jgi:hypothetical protein
MNIGEVIYLYSVFCDYIRHQTENVAGQKNDNIWFSAILDTGMQQEDNEE